MPRFSRRTTVGGIAVILFVTIVSLIRSDWARDRWMCFSRQDSYVPYQSLWVRVPPSRTRELIDYVQDFSDRNDLLFGSKVYPAGAAGLERETMVMQICNRIIDINIRNTHREGLFAAHVGRSASQDSEKFGSMYTNFVTELRSRFEYATPEEVRRAHE
jgi:hypothetical protein